MLRSACSSRLPGCRLVPCQSSWKRTRRTASFVQVAAATLPVWQGEAMCFESQVCVGCFACVGVCVHVCVCLWVRTCMHACARARVCVCHVVDLCMEQHHVTSPPTCHMSWFIAENSKIDIFSLCVACVLCLPVGTTSAQMTMIHGPPPPSTTEMRKCTVTRLVHVPCAQSVQASSCISNIIIPTRHLELLSCQQCTLNVVTPMRRTSVGVVTYQIPNSPL